jgi:hypothetical protein
MGMRGRQGGPNDRKRDGIMRIIRLLGSTGVAFILAFLASAPAVAQGKPSQPGEVILIGRLTRVMGIGGETTGWSLELNSDVTIEGQTFRAIEVSGPAKKLAKLANQEVKARGLVKHRHGMERRDWLVLEITSIRLKSPTGAI